ncbi:hypothetical protein [Aureibacter tunicatorum]|uniref:Virulence-associated protein VapD n=1 Tax=Aureibacter tunicatorum TaxID=866807 RepID=A0AAE4BS26_9BACT|nr:hypothetical protein [Aureibacter tunicatorum]MDR6238453.1 virulence-associated protein VapD [Aureibacter tunicatorum]BDD05613.1 hypothetical protein AUTU_30960 [Aureibacter tunicatorum]
MKASNLFKNFAAKALLMLMAIAFVSCSDDTNEGNGGDNGGGGDQDIPEGAIPIGGVVDQDLTLESGNVYWLGENLIVTEGHDLNVEPGVTVIADPTNVPEIVARGNFYAWGTQEEPILFTVPDEFKTDNNIYGAVWGGIMGGETTEEMAMTYVTVEYSGGPANANSEAVRLGKLDVGELLYSVFFNNNQGKLYMENSTVAHSGGDAIYVERGQVELFHNVVAYTGVTEDEAFNFKQGTTGDCAFNLMYSIATNGIKIGFSKPIEGDPQTNVNMYNNTMAFCGWRRDGERGGSINIEKGARGKIFNNLVVNGKYGTKVDASSDLNNTWVGHNYYYGEVDDSKSTGYVPHHGILPNREEPTAGDEMFWEVFNAACNVFDGQDILGRDDVEDPLFVNFDVDHPTNPNGEPSLELDYKTLDFSLRSDSPAANIGTTDIEPNAVFTEIGGKTITIPSPAEYAGAYAPK